jgi:hypothetical protein
MKEIFFLVFVLLCFKVSTYSQNKMFIYVEKYLDGKRVATSAEDSLDINIEYSVRGKKNSLKKEGPVFIYKSARLLKKLNVFIGGKKVTLKNKEILKNKTLVLKIENKSGCTMPEDYTVWYYNGGYVKVLNNSKKECSAKITVIKPWYYFKEDECVSNFPILIPYYLGLQQ